MSSCLNCGYASSDKTGCLLFNVPIEGKMLKNGCVFFRRNPKRCDICGSLLPPYVHSTLQKIDGGYATICDNCYAQLEKCGTCQNVVNCAFNILAQSSGIAPTVQQVIKQGNMQAIVQVKNPQLVQQACTNCPCYQNNKCIREKGEGCSSYLPHLVPIP